MTRRSRPERIAFLADACAAIRGAAPVPIASHSDAARTVGTALFADLTDDQRDQPLEHLAWYRANGARARDGAGAT
jgi:hypothetical protein